MAVSSVLYATGAALQGWLALMLWVGGKALRSSSARWPLLLAAAFAINTVRAVLLASGRGDVPLQSPAWVATSALGTTMVGLMTAGLVDYVGLAERSARAVNAAATAALAAIFALVVAGQLTRGAALIALTPFVGLWVALFAYATRREPRSGHGTVIGALLTFPLFAVAIRAGWLPIGVLPAAELIALFGVGVTVLTTGLIRAHRRAQAETAASAAALAAREQAQAELRAVNETLEQRVALRTRELRETIDGLESFNRSVSHDLRGPLGGIAGVAQLARSQLTRGNPAEAERLLDAIARQADKSVHLIAALLALARAGDAQPRRTRFDAAALVDEVVAALRQDGCAPMHAPSPEIVVGDLPAVDADRELLRQVFANLVGNACKFVNGTPHPRIEIGHAISDHGEAFYVRDNGVGFAPGEAGRLFKPFERLHGTGFEGFGVGLSIVRRIVDHHGGQVWAEAAPGQGATFWFTLPPG